MAETLSIKAEARDRAGKGAARAARRTGHVPGIVYGDAQPPQTIKLDGLLLRNLMRDPAFQTHLFELEVNGARTRVLARDVQLDPVSDQPIHIDFMRVGATSTITIAVPVHFINEAASPGLKRGGVLNVVRHDVELVCPAGSIPEQLTIDLTGTEIGASLRISLVALPEGVHPTVRDRDFVIATIAAPSAVRAEAVEAAAQGAAEPAEPGKTP